MSEIVAQFMTQTPVWAWVLLACLSFRGIRALRPAQTSLVNRAIVRAICTMRSVTGLVRLHGLKAETVALWPAGIAAGAVTGWRLLAHADPRADRATGLIDRPADLTAAAGCLRGEDISARSPPPLLPTICSAQASVWRICCRVPSRAS